MILKFLKSVEIKLKSYWSTGKLHITGLSEKCFSTPWHTIDSGCVSRDGLFRQPQQVCLRCIAEMALSIVFDKAWAIVSRGSRARD
jgi:hypothetical protein